MRLEKLEHLEARNCGQLKEIVSEGETNIVSSLSFEFPKLTTARFWKLPNLESFYGGAYQLRCSALNNLSVELCPELGLFRKDYSAIKPTFLPEKVIYNLNSIQIESRDANLLMEHANVMHTLEEFQLSGLKDTRVLYLFLYRTPNLKSLSLSDCVFEQLVPPRSLVNENWGFVPKLRCLKLMNLTKLKKIGFEEDTVLFQRLECLILKKCRWLNTIAPSSVSFTCLTNLEVMYCNKLSYLMTPSTAKSLFRLTIMKVIQCESMETIVSEQENKKSERITFRQLREIELVALHKLESFCSSNSCDFEFPSLEKVVVSACRKMEMFTSSKKLQVNETLRGVCVTHGEEKQKLYWEGDLDATIRHVFNSQKFFEGMGEMSFSNHPELLLAWQGEGAQNIHNWFHNLKILKLEKCDIQPYAIPYNILPYLTSLRELEVRDCIDVQVIFKMDVTEEGAGAVFQLQKLTLQGLPTLMYVWNRNAEGTHYFENLQLVFVSDCVNLLNVFPAALAKNLKKLEKLEIKKCDELQEIVEKEQGTGIQKFEFPCLTTLHLQYLPRLMNFYPESFILHSPELSNLFVFDCPELELFRRGGNRNPLFSNLKNITNVEELTLEWAHSLGLTSRLGGLTCNLDYLNNIRLFFDVDENEMVILPVEILRKAPNLEEMSIEFCHCLDIFVTQISEIEEKRMLTSLKTLTLNRVSKLRSIGSEDSPWLSAIWNMLHKLRVINCPDLKRLVHSTSAVSFFCVKELFISGCCGLMCLFTPSTVKMLTHLERIDVSNCESLKEIVAKEEDDTTSGEIKLGRLCRIYLKCLSKLECFYSGKYTLQLPSLKQADIWKCPKMENFSRGPIIVESSFKGIQASNDSNDELVLYDIAVNSSVKKVFLLQEFFDASLKNSVVSDHDVQAMWLGKMEILKLKYCNLRALIPFNILLLLKNLKELEVSNSGADVIFYRKEDTEITESTSQLKKLTLQRLSRLKDVWEKNSQRFLMFGNLQEVFISECKSLQTLFPASLANNLQKLEKLEIKSCDKLQGIVEKEEGTTANEETFVFPRLVKLNLCHLSQLTYFYPHTFTLECPILNSLYVSDCNKLELFQSVRPSGEGTSINRRPLISNLKVISSLKKLSLDWKDILVLSLRLKSEQFKEGLKDLKHISLSFFDTDKNKLPIEMLQKAPNLTEMSMDYCNKTKIGEKDMSRTSSILTLNDVWKHQFIEDESEEDYSLLNGICRKLLKLKILQCPFLTTLIHSTSKLSFYCLKEVSISNCHKLKYLFTSSAAKILMNLEKITVKKCDSVKEILVKEGDASPAVVKFERLNTIVLQSLPSLTCFYLSSDTMQLSSLVSVHIWRCPNMKCFSKGTIHAESFCGIQMSSVLEKDLLFHQDVDLLFHQDVNAALKAMLQRLVFFAALADEYFHEDFELKKDRHGNVAVRIQNKWLGNLVSLKLHRWTLSCAIPSTILPLLKKLEELEVTDSYKVQVIFDMSDIESMETAPGMKKLTLQRLGELEHVWEKNGEGVLIFGNLEEVIVSDCRKLKTLFPASPAKNLKELRKLEIKRCDNLEIIFEKTEGKWRNRTKRFVLPRLEMLDLYELRQLAYFCPQTLTLICPALKTLSVLMCRKLELFQSEGKFNRWPLISNLKVLRLDWIHIPELSLRFKSKQFVKVPLISNLKVISKVNVLRLDWKHFWALNLRISSHQFVEGFKYLNEISLFFDTDKNEIPMLPIHILGKAPKLTEMSINSCNELCLFLSQTLNIGENGILGQLKVLTLSNVSMHKCMESLESLWLNTICEKIWELKVVSCPGLEKLVETLSLSGLKKVSISHCPDLLCLFTPSAAEKLTNLEKITVEECKSMKEIVSKEGSANSEAIKFERLNTIVLRSLPSLICFYSGSHTMELPSLKTVHIRKCPKISIFSQGRIYAESFHGIQMSSDLEDGLLFHQDLNTTIRSMLPRQEFFEVVVKRCYPKKGELQADSHGNVAVGLQNIWLHGLVTLNLDKCILPHAIPSVIFPYLKNLEELKVQGNDKVKVVFDMNDTEMLETASRLKTLTLCRLSELERVWAENWQGVLFFRNLQEVSVSDCEKLQTLFPASLAKDLQKLEKLVVKRCVNLQEIVEKKEGTAAITTENFVFPRLEKLNLDDLPEVTYFYPQTFTLECPILSNLSILDCTKLELFQSLVTLNLDKCILPHASPSVIFPYLKNLEELKVQGNDKVKVVFDMNDTEMLETASRLRILTLCRLSELEHVWAKNWPGVLFFQNLQEVSVSDCEKLQTLFPASLAKDLQKLEKLVVKRCVNLKEIVEKKEGTAATTTENFLFPRLEKLDLDDLPEVTYFYPQTVTLECPILSNLSILDCTKLELFQSLVTLNLDKCILPHAIPSVIFPYLKNLEELKVQGNDKVKVVFDMNDTEMLETASQLKILTLCRLSELERVWAKNWKGVLFFRNLQEVSVSDCEKLQTLFPVSLAKDLQKLEKLVVNRCVNLQAIVEKKEGTAATTTENFIFPRLEKLDLDDLPEVTYFYPQTFILECPTLSNLSILDCTKLELFQSAHPTAESSSSNIQSHMSNLKSLSNVKELTLDWKHISALNLWFKSEQCQEGLDYLEEIVLYFGADENEKAMLPIEILQKAPNLTHLDIGFCKSSKTFFAENPEIDVGRMLGQLTILTLDEVSMLQSIVSKNSLWLNTICEKLHELNVYSCPHLMTLVHSPSRVSFSCLKQVSIIRCPNLHNLFTSSAAKKLISLENITVKHCQSVTKIVANERDENEHKGEGEDELIFGKLEILKLVSLPKFESFYTGRSTLNFPSFKDVRFTNCDSTKIFRLGDKVPATLKVEIDGDYWKGDINSVIMKHLEE